MNLVRAEISRFFSRRFLLVMLVMLVGAFAITIFTVMASSTKPTEQDWAQARQQAAETRVHTTAEYNNCREALTDERVCEQYNPARVTPEDYLYGVFHFERQIEPLLYFLGAFLSLFAFLVSASYLGAEMHSGGMTNLLLWRPNRLAVLGAKLAVNLGAVALISTVFAAVYLGTFYGIASATGFTGDLTADFWGSVILLCLRGVGLAVVAAGIAFAISAIGQRTAAALGSLLGYVIIWETGARVVFETVRQANVSTDPWFLSTYIGAWFIGKISYYVPQDVVYYSTNYEDNLRHIYWWQSGIVFAIVAAAMLAVAFANFRRRDIA